MTDLARGFFNILLPTGENVNILTEEGANTFISTNDTFFGFSSNIEMADKLRKKKKLNRQQKEDLKMIYILIGEVADNATDDVFDNVSKHELKSYFEHVTRVLKSIITDVKWIRTGILQDIDREIINNTVPLMKRVHAVEMAFECNYFKVLAELIAARKAPSLPCPEIATLSCATMNNARISLLRPMSGNENEKADATTAKSFKRFEACGILAQFLRCSTTPSAADPGMFMCYNELLRCQSLIKKKFKKGEPCGDVVHDILFKIDGDSHCSKRITEYLKNIAFLARLSQSDKNDLTTVPNRVCRYCNEGEFTKAFQESLRVCSRCQVTYYCTKECQRSDWKKHKLTCNPFDKEVRKAMGNTDNVTLNFLKCHYEPIMLELIRICDETGLNKKEMLLQADFKPGPEGEMAPALSGKFKIGVTRRYLEGDRPDEPDWFVKNEDEACYKTNIASFLPALRDQYDIMTNNNLLLYCRFNIGHSVKRTSLENMFSDEAFEAFQKATKEHDYGPMESLFSPAIVEKIKRFIMKSKGRNAMDTAGVPKYDGTGEPSQDQQDVVRRMLNMNFGADFEMRGVGKDRGW